MNTLKEIVIQQMIEQKADIRLFKFKYYKESPYQKKRYKPEHVESECWVYPKNRKSGYVITDETAANKAYFQEYISMIIAETNAVN